MKTNIRIILGMILLFSIFPLTTAVECIGQGCSTNMSINVVNVTAIPTPRFSILGATIYSLLDSSGAGLGTFFQFLGASIPILLIGIMMVALIVAIAYAIFEGIGLWKQAKET
jgi:multidrug transporter EmrE-like cation transporter